jgi:hypothetical protein
MKLILKVFLFMIIILLGKLNKEQRIAAMSANTQVTTEETSFTTYQNPIEPVDRISQEQKKTDIIY